ncbi:sulfatase [Enemella evansiae]|uniref:Sulfatase n=1 Tax=Enemella evansiae TaxID=2016499 RepID=A0A255G2Q3_9ACTN|nr:sulfatase [Enemella evansiae]OYO08646.1 sulfatase [Enemella evansiae]
MQRPNIIYFHTHDTGRYIAPYGHAVPTPNLQRLAGDGVVFRQAYAAAPTCSPSRAALLTGQAPHTAGMLGLAHRGFGLHDNGQHLLHTLRAAGYHTAMVGQQHVSADPHILGYDEVFDTEDVRADWVLPPAEAYLAREHDRPFFLSIGLVETHTHPIDGQLFGYPPDDERWVAPAPTVADGPATRADMAGFHASARVADAALGRVLAALDAAGLTENTLIIVTTDHGIPLPGMKGTLSDRGTGVMLLLRGPGFRGGRVCDALVSQIDIFPTLCELLGIEVPGWVQGRSFLGVLDGGEINEEVYSELTWHVAYDPQRAIRTRRWKYVQRFSTRGLPTPANTDDSPSKDSWLAADWPDRERPFAELYDLALDPGEGTNLAGLPAYAEIETELRQRLAAWMRRTDDPLLAGPVPAPDGFWVDPDQVSAQVV